MPVDPPKIDREAVLKKEAATRRVKQLLKQILPLLQEHEGLGVPYREGNLILLPVLREDDGGGGGAVPQASSGAGP